MNEKWVSALFPEPLAKRARVLAAQVGISRGELIRRATAEYTSKIEKEIGEHTDTARSLKGNEPHEQHA